MIGDSHCGTGNLRLLEFLGIDPEPAQKQCEKFAEEGKTPLIVVHEPDDRGGGHESQFGQRRRQCVMRYST